LIEDYSYHSKKRAKGIRKIVAADCL